MKTEYENTCYTPDPVRGFVEVPKYALVAGLGVALFLSAYGIVRDHVSNDSQDRTVKTEKNLDGLVGGNE